MGAFGTEPTEINHEGDHVRRPKGVIVMGESKGPFPWALIGIWATVLISIAVAGWSIYLMVTAG